MFVTPSDHETPLAVPNSRTLDLKSCQPSAGQGGLQCSVGLFFLSLNHVWALVLLGSVLGTSGCIQPDTPSPCGHGDCGQEARLLTPGSAPMCVQPLELGATCDPADPTNVCDNFLACRDPDRNGEYRCVELEASGFFASCSTEAARRGDLCNYRFAAEQHTLCTPASCFEPENLLVGPQGAVCQPLLQFQEPCDGNFEDIHTASSPEERPCHPCAPGLRCVGGFCLKPCRDAVDCPCNANTGQPQTSCVSLGPDQGGVCAQQCRTLGQSCEGSLPCCNSNLTCSDPEVGEQGTCELTVGSECQEDQPCIGDSTCIFGRCEPFRAEDEPCQQDTDCRGDLQCNDEGRCDEPCVQGRACTASEAEGACREGTTTCPGDDPFVEPQCDPAMPSDETCNGVDDDCDSEIDNIASEGCMVVPEQCEDREGFEVQGSMECVETGFGEFERQCVPGPSINEDIENGTWCDSTNEGRCGASAATVCSPEFGRLPCAPNRTCSGFGGGPPPTCQQFPGSGVDDADQTCSFETIPDCWFPRETGKCVDPFMFEGS